MERHTALMSVWENNMNGFFYHQKHDPEKGIDHHAYEVIGIGFHTEDETEMVVYRPLYRSDHQFFVRPLSMWNEMKDGIPRFIEIVDEKLIQRLTGSVLD